MWHSRVLTACGDNLTRENVMKHAASIHDLKLPMLLPGITVSTSADDLGWSPSAPLHGPGRADYKNSPKPGSITAARTSAGMARTVTVHAR